MSTESCVIKLIPKCWNCLALHNNNCSKTNRLMFLSSRQLAGKQLTIVRFRQDTSTNIANMNREDALTFDTFVVDNTEKFFWLLSLVCWKKNNNNKNKQVKLTCTFFRNLASSIYMNKFIWAYIIKQLTRQKF